MTREEIEQAVAEIAKMGSWDDERAHCSEDQLREAFIRHVADTAGGELSELARLVLTTSDMEFSRWYA
jgi:hypothetical protein